MEAKVAYHGALSSARLLGEIRVEAEILPRLAALHRKLGEESFAKEIEVRVRSLPVTVEAEE